MASTQSHRIEPQAVQEIFADSSSGLPKASPLERVGQSKTNADTHGSFDDLKPDNINQSSFSRETAISPATRPSRLSVSFPTARKPMPVVDEPTRSSADSSASSEPEGISSSLTRPADNTLLTAIATQERRVLELKEEMLHAEAELNRLKKQWAQHEARRKRRSSQNLSTLGPGQLGATSAASTEADMDGSNAWIQQEVEKRKALMNQNRSATRTVFAGSKHTRALSLVSGSQPKDPPRSLPQREKSVLTNGRASGPIQPQQPETSRRQTMPLARASTTPDVTTLSVEPALNERSIDGDVLLQTGKKMANDLRDGLWTFWEDIRQAAVGDEAPSDQPLSTRPSPRSFDKALNRSGKKQSATWLPGKGAFPNLMSRPSPERANVKSAAKSTMSSGGSSASALADPSFWTEHGFTLHSTRTDINRKGELEHAIRPGSVMDSQSDEGWDAWDDAGTQHGSARDSPSSSVGSGVNTLPTSASDSASPRMSSEKSVSRPSSGITSDGPIPWPTLSSHGPSTLPRSASRLVSEWEEVEE